MNSEPRTRAILDLDTHPDKFVTVPDLAYYWKVSPKTLYNAIDKGALPCTRIGGTIIRVQTDDARRYGNPKTHTHDSTTEAQP